MITNFSPAVNLESFEAFKSSIRHEYMEGSGICEAFFEQVVFRSNTEIGAGGTPVDGVADMLNWRRKQAGYVLRKELHGAFLPEEDEAVWQGKLSRLIGPTGLGEVALENQQPKVAPKGAGSRCFLPAIPNDIRKLIGERYGVQVPEDGSFWGWLEDHPRIPIVITEGGKKSLSLLSQGYVAIAVYGVNAGYSVKDANGFPCSAFLIPSLARFACKNRVITIAFDQDTKSKTVIKVNKAIVKLANLLKAAGAKVRVAVWERKEGKGIDDAIVKAGDNVQDWLKNTIDSAPTLEKWSKDERKERNHRIMRWLNSNNVQPERTTTDRYIPELPALTPGMIHGVQSTGTGDGKTTAIGKWVDQNRAAGGFSLVLYHANSVGKQAAKDWDLPHIHDARVTGVMGRGMGYLERAVHWQDAVERGGCVLCYDSLHKIPADILERVNLIILDECNQGIAHLCEGGTLKARQSGIMEIAAETLRAVIRRGGAIVLSEVTIYQRTIEYVKTLSECSAVRLFSHERSNCDSWDVDLFAGSTAGFFERAELALNLGKKIIFAVASQEQGEKFDGLIKSSFPNKKIIRIDAKTNDKGEFDDFWAAPDQWLRDNGIPDLLIYSPSGKSGVSITESGFDEVWGHFTSHHPDMWMQMIGRYRLAVPRKIFVVPFVLAYSGDERLCSVRAVKRRLEANRNGFVKSHGIDLAARLLEAQEEGLDTERLFAIEQATIDFLAAERTAIGAQKAIAKDYFVHLMEQQGHRVTQHKCPLMNLRTKTRLKEIQEELWREKAAIGACLQEGDDRKDIPTWHKEILAFKLRCREEFPGIDFDDAEDFYQALVKDRGSMRRGVLLHAAAENHLAAVALEKEQVQAILTRKIALPHTLPRMAMQARLIELTGVLALLDGDPYQNGGERAESIKQTALKWRSEIYYWLGLNVNDDQTPVQICNKLLKKLGLDGDAISRPGTHGVRDRIYQVGGTDDPVRNRLLAAARQRLASVVNAQPSFDEATVQDGLALLAGTDQDTLPAVWAALETLPQADQNEIRARFVA